MEKALVEFQRSSRREVVEALLEVLAFATKLVKDSESGGHVILSFFEPNCDHLAPANSELKLYGVVWENFYSELLPAIERQQELTATTNQQQPGGLTPFSQRFSPDEIEDALMNYDDEFGTWRSVNVTNKSEKHMLTKEQAQDQLASIYLRAKVARLEQKTRRRAIEYINSTLGVAHFERTARALAHEMVKRRRRLRKLYKKHEKDQRHLDSRRAKLHRKIEAFQRAKEARLKTTRDKCGRLEKDHEALKHELEIAMAKDKGGALAAAKSKKLGKVDEKLSKLKAELEESGPENAKIYDIEQAIENLNMEERKLHKATEKARAWEMDADIEDEDGEEEGEDESDNETPDDGDHDGDEEESDSEKESDEEEAPETEASKVSSTAPTDSPPEPFFDIEMPDMNIDDYRKAAVKVVDQELEKRAIGEIEKNAKNAKPSVTIAAKKPNFTMPLDVPEEELMELFQAQIRDSYVEMQCSKVSKQATKEFLQMRAVLQRWRGMGTRAVFEAWHEVARASRLDANAVKARAERKKLLEKQNRELEEQLARIEARLWVQRSDMYTDAIYYENEQSGETRWEPPQYWADEQRQRQNMRIDDVPRLKLPPI
ncbi:hypothetical protein JG688_00005683 [Phytophthora aleatoria]|uniref:WW domain-containing protein n=1 Tax=Phytophthora aleatoria TaxID=2496075 RepID=A0A8J5MA64_9STRA|nr:hypothetical protein JG688_00005683 [Phytophthora aleatoria]